VFSADMPIRHGTAHKNIMFLLVIGAFSIAFFVPPDLYNAISELSWAQSFSGYFDKVFHSLFFAAVFFAFPNIFAKRGSLKIALGLFAFGVMIELVQYFIPYRGASVDDVMANSLGLIMGGLARYKFTRF